LSSSFVAGFELGDQAWHMSEISSRAQWQGPRVLVQDNKVGHCSSVGPGVLEWAVERAGWTLGLPKGSHLIIRVCELSKDSSSIGVQSLEFFKSTLCSREFSESSPKAQLMWSTQGPRLLASHTIKYFAIKEVVSKTLI